MINQIKHLDQGRTDPETVQIDGHKKVLASKSGRRTRFFKSNSYFDIFIKLAIIFFDRIVDSNFGF